MHQALQSSDVDGFKKLMKERFDLLSSTMPKAFTGDLFVTENPDIADIKHSGGFRAMAQALMGMPTLIKTGLYAFSDKGIMMAKELKNQGARVGYIVSEHGDIIDLDEIAQKTGVSREELSENAVVLGLYTHASFAIQGEVIVKVIKKIMED